MLWESNIMIIEWIRTLPRDPLVSDRGRGVEGELRPRQEVPGGARQAPHQVAEQILKRNNVVTYLYQPLKTNSFSCRITASKGISIIVVL